MKNFIFKITIGFLILVTILYGLDKIATYGLSKSKGSSFKDLNDLYYGKTNAEIILLGSSRTYVMMNPIIFDTILKKNTHNFGQDGATIHLQKTIFKDVINYNKNSLEVVVQNIDLTTLLPNKKNYSKQRFYPHLNKASLYTNLSSFDSSFWKYKYLPLYKFNGSLSLFIRGLLLSCNIPFSENYTKIKGYKPRHVKWNNDFENYLKTLEDDEIVYDDDLIEDGFKIIEEFIQETAKKGLKYVIVFAPMYSEMYNMQVQNEALKEKIKEYTAKYEHVSFYDYSKLPMNKNKEYFYNSYHLNSKGADAFSEIFANDMKVKFGQ